jgi:hypothetical protein
MSPCRMHRSLIGPQALLRLLVASPSEVQACPGWRDRELIAVGSEAGGSRLGARQGGPPAAWKRPPGEGSAGFATATRPSNRPHRTGRAFHLQSVSAGREAVRASTYGCAGRPSAQDPGWSARACEGPVSASAEPTGDGPGLARAALAFRWLRRVRVIARIVSSARPAAAAASGPVIRVPPVGSAVAGVWLAVAAGSPTWVGAVGAEIERVLFGATVGIGSGVKDVGDGLGGDVTVAGAVAVAVTVTVGAGVGVAVRPG